MKIYWLLYCYLYFRKKFIKQGKTNPVNLDGVYDTNPIRQAFEPDLPPPMRR